MIKRLRLQFLGISMALITVMLLVILGLICRFSWVNLHNTALSDLQSAVQNRPAYKKASVIQNGQEHYFILWIAGDGEVEAYCSAEYDLSDTQLLRQLLAHARGQKKTSGILLNYSLAYTQLEQIDSTCYAFMDVSTRLESFQVLVLICASIGLAADLLFFGLMWMLSKWIVRPVEEAWDRQRQFVADASHELKTPLTVILTNAELLQSDEFDKEAKARFTTSIHSMAVQMRGLVEYLLSLARVDHGDAQISKTGLDLSTLTEEAVLPFEAVYFEAGKNLESSIEPEIHMAGSPQHLRQVLEILLDNGCKYSAPGSTVILRLARQAGHRVLLSVSSPGEMLTQKQCDDIFKRFYRLDAARKMNHSYGLGLAIAQSIVEAHKGHIWCESKDGENTFYVNLPT